VKCQHRVPRRRACFIAIAACLAGGTPALLRAAGNPAPPAAMASSARATAATTILGSAWNADNSPIPEAKLRLRSVITGRIEAATIADAAGQFVFSKVEGGTYVVELVNEDGRVLTVGRPFVAMRGETVATFVRLGARRPRLAGFFGNAAAAAIASAASLGVTALAPTAPPVSAKR